MRIILKDLSLLSFCETFNSHFRELCKWAVQMDGLILFFA